MPRVPKGQPRKRAPSVLLKDKCPHLRDEWHFEDNAKLGFTFDTITSGSSYKVVWYCDKCDLKYEAKVQHRTDGRGCPGCAGKRPTAQNNLESVAPHLVEEWSSENEISPKDVTPQSSRAVSWKCGKCKHIWVAPVKDRYLGTGCPGCKTLVSDSNNLRALFPNVADEWHSTKNGDLTPETIHAHSKIPVWWKCSICHHEWIKSPHDRTGSAKYGPRCPRTSLHQM